MSRIDRAFHRYVRTRDPRALAYVFDHAAPELLTLARCLAGQAAEDVLQDSFLVAIERAAAFEAGARVLPWLCGILVHKAKEARRRTRAHEPRDPTAADLSCDPAPGPDAEAVHGEMVGRVREALARLPERYRAVMAPILQEGLAPDDVARRLDRNPSTVRTQVARGLEHLRRLLPALGAVGLVDRAAAAEQIRRVRRAVLEAGGDEVAVTSGGAPGLVLGLGAIVVLGVAAALLASTGTGIRADHATPAVAGTSGADRPPELGEAPKEPRIALPDERGRASPPSPSAVEVRGVCVDAESGAPLAGCDVALHGNVLNQEAWLYWGDPGWQDPEPVRTGADGRFAHRVEPSPALSYRLVVRAPERPIVHTNFVGADVASGIDLAELRLERGRQVSGRVVDENGNAVAGVHLQLRWRGTSRAGFEEGGSTSFETGADGAWQPRSDNGPRVLARTYLFSPGFGRAGDEYTLGPSAVQPVALPEARPTADGSVRLDLVVRRPVTIAGRVVDESDAPVVGVNVAASTTEGSRSGLSGMASSGAGGGFRILALPDTQGMARLRVSGDFDTLAPQTPVEWGANDVVLRVRRRASVPEPTPGPSPTSALDVVVVDAVTGAPVERFGLRLHGARVDGHITQYDSQLREAGDHAGGRARIESPTAGPRGLEVIPGRGHHRVRQDVEFPAEGVATVRVAVEPVTFPRLSVRVLRSDGVVVSGADVEVIEVYPGKTVTEQSFVESPFGFSAGRIDGAERGRGTTDAHGICDIEVSRRNSVDTFTLRVRAPDLPAAILAGVHLPGERGDAVVTLPAGAELRVRLEPASLSLLAPQLRLLRNGRQMRTSPPSDGVGLPFASDGTLVIRGLAPGEAQPELVGVVVLGFPVPHRLELLAPIRLEAGRTTDLVARVPRLTPGRLHGRVVRAGEPRWPQATELMLEGAFEGPNPPPIPNVMHPKYGPFRTAPDGTFDAVLSPGRYRLVALWAKEGQPHLRSVEDVVVEPDRDVEQTFVMQ